MSQSSSSFLNFQYNLSKLPLKRRSFEDRKFSDLMLTFEPDIEEMKKVYNKISGTEGKISRRDLRSLLEKLGQTNATCQAKQMMDAADLNKDGFIDFDEFMEVHKKGVKISEIKRAFFVFDRDGDGRISAEDLHKTFLRLEEKFTIAECETMVKKIDGNGDGLVDMDDFMSMMTRSRQKA
ncbi:calmodulin-like protein 30 [Typha latifolia]|uniref:calmodulin-like protein 30 n=1 Tax=Typha latifolia TaxID=4733 RepID=UPI003C2BBC28